MVLWDAVKEAEYSMSILNNQLRSIIKDVSVAMEDIKASHSVMGMQFGKKKSCLFHYCSML